MLSSLLLYYYSTIFSYPPYPPSRHIRRGIPPDALQLHKHPLLMLVLHHYALNSCKWTADYNYAVAGNERRHFSLIDNDVLIAGFYDNLKTIHLCVRHNEKFVFAKLVGVKMIIIRRKAGELCRIFQERFKIAHGTAHKKQTAVEGLVLGILSGIFEIFVGIFDVAEQREIRFDAVVVECDELVIDLLCSLMRCADRKPITDIRQESAEDRLPDLDALPLGIDTYFLFSAHGQAVMRFLAELGQCCHF